LEKIATISTNQGSTVFDEALLTQAERRLERIINRAIDINLHLLRATNSPPPNDYTESFRKLGELQIIPQQLANDLAPCAGTRNVLIHAYDDVREEEFFSAIDNAKKLFPEYITTVENYLASNSTQ